MLSRKLSDRVKIQTTYQGRPDKDEEAPLDDVSSRFVRGSLASPESRASLRSAHRGITEPAVQQRLRARWIPGDWWRRPSFFSPHHAAASQRALASKQARNRRRAAPAVRPLHDESRACGDANTSRSRMSKPPPPCHPGRVLRPPRGRTVSDSPSGLYFIYHLDGCCSGSRV